MTLLTSSSGGSSCATKLSISLTKAHDIYDQVKSAVRKAGKMFAPWFALKKESEEEKARERELTAETEKAAKELADRNLQRRRDKEDALRAQQQGQLQQAPANPAK